MNNSIALSLGQKFEIERINRDIDSLKDREALRALVKDLLLKWQCERATGRQLMLTQLGQLGQLGNQPPSI